MEIWFLGDLARLSREREAIRELESREAWLAGTSWRFDRVLAVDAIIKVGGREFPVRMTYPEYFPVVPPSVHPLDPDVRWSNHQYGAGGALCLEWGPDTWHPDVTGSQLLESAFKLLSLEGESEAAGRDLVPTRHSISLGQALRGTYSRLHHGPSLRGRLASLPAGSRGRFDFSSHWSGGEGLYLVQAVHADGGEPWEDPTIPEGMRDTADQGYLRSGRFFVVDGPSGLVPASLLRSDLERNLKERGFSDPIFGDEIAAILLVDAVGAPQFFLNSQATPGSLHPIPSVSSEAESAGRNPVEYEVLEQKSIGIVGLGSVGSKMALSLARMGFSRFYLVDEDVLLPENVCRHALDWLYVGYHKVDAVRDALRRIRAGVEVEVSRLNLTGQESNAALSATLRHLGHCDLIVDATAEPGVFNLLASVSTMNRRPLVWLEVYAGGIGGMIARSRPGVDPGPHRVRDVYHEYTSLNPAPDLRTVGDYAARTPSGATMVASDGDVGVIAASAARFTADTALGRTPSDFPHSIYLIGLRPSWVFSQPFHTIPIDCGSPDHEEPGESLAADQVQDQIQFIGELIGNEDDENPHP